MVGWVTLKCFAISRTLIGPLPCKRFIISILVSQDKPAKQPEQLECNFIILSKAKNFKLCLQYIDINLYVRYCQERLK